MMKRLKVWFGIAVILVVGVLVLRPAWLKTALAQGKSEITAVTSASGESSVPRTITVVGQGTVKIQPDIANVTIGVETIGSSVQDASAENAEIMDAVVAALRKQGILQADMQTSGYGVWTDRERSMDGKLSGQVNYQVNNSLNVVVRDLDTLSEMLDAAISAGANSIHGIRFSVDESELLESEARTKAVSDAKAKAQELAELNDVSVGNVVAVSEVISGGGIYGSNFETTAMAKYGLGGGVGPISPGELEMSMQLQVIYEIQ